MFNKVNTVSDRPKVANAPHSGQKATKKMRQNQSRKTFEYILQVIYNSQDVYAFVTVSKIPSVDPSVKETQILPVSRAVGGSLILVKG